MKKMNLSFLGLKAKIVLPLFLLVGLFMISASTVSAQYVTEQEAKVIVDNQISKLPPRTASLRRVGQDMNPKMIEEDINSLRHYFAHSIGKKIAEGFSVAEAIEKSYIVGKDRIHKETLDMVKQEYIDLLTE